MSATTTSAPAPVKREVTQKMIEANRLNSLKSTGPKTEAGKARSSQNSITHGIFAQNMALSEEEQDLYDQFRLEMLVEMNPANFQEMRCAEIVVNCYWKLRRCDAAEMRLLNKAMFNVDKYAAAESDRAFAHAIARERDYGLARLGTYQQRLLNQAHKAMRELRQLRKESILPADQRSVKELAPFLKRQLEGEGYVYDEPEQEQEQEQNNSEPVSEQTFCSESQKAKPCAEASVGPAMNSRSEDGAADEPMKIEAGTAAPESPPEYRKSA